MDTVPPSLTIISSAESPTAPGKLRLEAEARDPWLATVRIIVNGKTADEFLPGRAVFIREIQLVPGLNEIKVEALDRAGNSSRQSLVAFSDLRNAAALFNKYGNGPNPFSPASDRQMFFTYDLSAPGDVKIYIFNIGGTLVWQKTLPGVMAGALGWDGRDQFGAPVHNGVYPYIIQVTAGGAVEIGRGKVIILQ
jgi:hypothetical protein